MPSTAQPVSTMADVLRLVQAVFSFLGDGTPLLIGAAFLDEPGPGSGPRVVFVPDENGAFAPAQKIGAGYVASWAHGCTVYVRGVEPGDDAGRLEPAYVLAARVATVLKALDPAHISATPGGPRDDSPQRVPGPGGADIVFRFTYVANIAQDPAILRAVRQVVSISPPNPDQPGGDTGNTFVVSAPAVAERP